MFKKSHPKKKCGTACTEFFPLPLPLKAAQDMRFIAPYISNKQAIAIATKLHSDDKTAIMQRIVAVAYVIETMAVTPEQNDIGVEATAYLHYRCNNDDLYVIERGENSDIAVGYFLSNGECKRCSLSLHDLISNDVVELDFDFMPCTVANIHNTSYSGVKRG